MDGRFTIRPIEAGDAERLGRLFFRLSPETVYFRFFRPVVRPSTQFLRHLAEVDYVHREAVVATLDDEIVGVARWDEGRAPGVAEVAIVVEDAWHHKGIGHALMAELTRRARGQGLEAFTASMLADNRPAVALFRAMAGPAGHLAWDHGEVVARVPLAS